MTAWTVHLNKTFKAGRNKDSTYSYKDAMVDASKTYNICRKISIPVCLTKPACKNTVNGKRKSYCRRRKNKSRKGGSRRSSHSKSRSSRS